MGYVTFLFDLTAMAEGTIRPVRGSLKFRPDSAIKPTNAFAWKVTRDSNGIVAVRALRDKRLVLIAHAKFKTTKLVDREQLGSEPTMHQWHAVEECIRMAVAERVEKGGDEDVISEPLDSRELEGMKESGPSYSQAIAAEIREDKRRRGGDKSDHREWRGWERKKPDGKAVLIGVGGVILASVGVYFAVGYSAKKSSSPSSTRATTTSGTAAIPAAPELSATPAPPPPEPAPPAAPSSLAEVLAATPALDVETLASYRVRWSDVDVASQTTLAKVEKDPDAEKGKHVCVDGTIERITKKELASRTHYAGALVTTEGDRVAFVASGSTGELVKRDAARLCGVVTGTQDGASAVFGMFDLPENRNPVVEMP